MPASWKLPALIFGACALVTAATVAIVLAPKQEPVDRDRQPGGVEAPLPATAAALHAEYAANEIAAEKKYHHRFVKVTGVVLDVNRDRLEMGGGGGGRVLILCKWKPEHRDGFAGARRGQPFAVVGACTGLVGRDDEEESYVYLVDCRAAAP